MLQIAERVRAADGNADDLSDQDLDSFQATTAEQREAVSMLRLVLTERPKPPAQELSHTAKTEKVRDAFALFTPTYTVGGKQVGPVPSSFRMQWGDNLSEKYATIVALLRKGNVTVTQALGYAIMGAISGRGSAEDIRKTTQAMLDAGGLENEAALPENIRYMQSRYGVGTDCKNSVYRTAMRVQGKPVPANHANVSSQGVQVSPKKPENLAPGDAIVLKGAPGHVVMVAANDPLAGVSAEHDPFFEGGKVRRIEVWSSWGGVGITRHFFLYNETTKRWAMCNDEAEITTGNISSEAPGNVYSHPILRMGTPL